MSDEKKKIDNDDAYLDLLKEYSKDTHSHKSQPDKQDDLHNLVSQRQKKDIDFKVQIDGLNEEIKKTRASDKAPEPKVKRKPVFYSPTTNGIGEKKERSRIDGKRTESAHSQPQRRIVRRPDAQNVSVTEGAGAQVVYKNKEGFTLKGIERFLNENKQTWIIVLVCIVFAILISSYTISCINDVLAINRDSEEVVTITIPNDAKTKDILKLLDDNKLINHRYFCSLVSSIMSYNDDKYLAGIYYVTPSMGFEKMLSTFKSPTMTGETVTLAFPEGYSIDQIAEKLQKYEVCTADAFYKTLQEIDFGLEYEFIKAISNKDERYHYLEGYMYPDTYDFFVGENAAGVIRKFLDNFQKKWTDEYKAQAEKMNMSIDEVIRLASIVEKEAYGAPQMPKVSSVLHNRLNKSGLFPTLQCDATTAYINNFIAKRVTSSSELAVLTSKYSTKRCVGLPVGAICNPGNDAIKAALFPEKADYYFFLHDNNKNLYLARNDAEHQKNGIEALKANDASKKQT